MWSKDKDPLAWYVSCCIIANDNLHAKRNKAGRAVDIFRNPPARLNFSHVHNVSGRMISPVDFLDFEFHPRQPTAKKKSTHGMFSLLRSFRTKQIFSTKISQISI